MSRLIDADALLVSMWKMLYALEDKAEKDFVGTDNHDEWFYTFRPWLQRGHEIGVIAVNDAPTADVVPVKHGHWIDMGDFEQCSKCKGTHLKEFNSYYGKVTWIRTEYCPNCGAKMDLLDDDTKWETIENGVKVAKYNCTAEEIEEVKEIMEKRFFADGEKTGDRK